MVLLTIIYPHAQTKNFSSSFSVSTLLTNSWIYLESDSHSILFHTSTQGPTAITSPPGYGLSASTLCLYVHYNKRKNFWGEGVFKNILIAIHLTPDSAWSGGQPAISPTSRTTTSLSPHGLLSSSEHTELILTLWLFKGNSCLKCLTLRFLLTGSLPVTQASAQILSSLTTQFKVSTSLPCFTNIFLQCSYMKLSYLLVLSVFPPPENICSTTTGLSLLVHCCASSVIGILGTQAQWVHPNSKNSL